MEVISRRQVARVNGRGAGAFREKPIFWQTTANRPQNPERPMLDRGFSPPDSDDLPDARGARAWPGRAARVWAVAGTLLAACNAFEPPKVISAEPGEPPDAAAAGGAMVPAPEVDAGADVWVLAPPSGADGPAAEAAVAVPVDVVYAHSGSDLYRVDPETLAVSRIGPFTLQEGGITRPLNNVTDIAVDRGRRIVGLTYNRLLEIDGATGACKAIAPLPMGQRFNGLSWIRSAGGPEALVATSFDGGVFRIDPATGVAALIGNLGGGLQSSGDLVSVESYGTLLTVRGPAASDRLARLDPMTGVATVIGNIGFADVWGLGFWKNRVFGFTNTGGFLLINPVTGAGMLAQRFPAFPFFGAGVTTEAPVVID
jgi:hypothetical protein